MNCDVQQFTTTSDDGKIKAIYLATIKVGTVKVWSGHYPTASEATTAMQKEAKVWRELCPTY